MKQTMVTLYVREIEPNWTCGFLLNKIRLDDNGHSIIMVSQTISNQHPEDFQVFFASFEMMLYWTGINALY